MNDDYHGPWFDITQYTLPTIHFVGGANETFMFRCFKYKRNDPVDMTGCTANFAIIDYANKYGKSIFTKSMKVAKGDKDYEGDVVSNVLTVELAVADTLNLTGKYIYQISVKDGKGRADIPNHGIIYILNNIDKPFLS